MEKEKMSIHRALAELKLIDSKLNKEIANGIYCETNPFFNKEIRGKSIKEFEEKVIQASYDRVTDLFKRRTLIKAAITQSNANTSVTIAGASMSIAEAIERKTSINMQTYFLDKMKSHYASAITKMEKHNNVLPSKAEAYVSGLYQDKNSVDSVKIKALHDDYIKENTLELIDPIKIREKIEELENFIEEFSTEVDFKLSESNATTFIEI